MSESVRRTRIHWLENCCNLYFLRGFMSTESATISSNFIRTIIDDDLASGTHQTIVTRFPPDPIGYLHIVHPNPICLTLLLSHHFGYRSLYRLADPHPDNEA